MALEWDKFYTLDLDLYVVHWTPIYTENNITDSPSCSPVQIIMAQEMHTYLMVVTTIPPMTFLHGREQLSKEDTESLFLKVLEFIM